jgi:hypothetical protein
MEALFTVLLSTGKNVKNMPNKNVNGNNNATIAVSLQSRQSQLTLYARNITNAVCIAPHEDKQVMFETCRGP